MDSILRTSTSTVPDSRGWQKRVSSYFAERYLIVSHLTCYILFFEIFRFFLLEKTSGCRRDLTKRNSMTKSKKSFALDSTESTEEFLNISEGVIDERLVKS